MTTNHLRILVAALAAVTVFGQPARNITFNGRPLTAAQWTAVENLERSYQVRLPEAAYWYDNRTGAFGFWNGPTAAILPAGLGLGGALPANASGGATLVFVNGRALHPLDIAALSQIMPVQPGRFWMDSNGDFGYESGPRIGNLIAIASARGGGGGGAQHRTYAPGELSGVIVNPAGACTNSGCIYH